MKCTCWRWCYTNILQAIKLIPHQGKPKTIYDNGTNFQGAWYQWHEVYNMLQCFPQKERIQNFLASEGCDSKFIPQHGPHFRGLWEAAVISMKYHLRHSLGTRMPSMKNYVHCCLRKRHAWIPDLCVPYLKAGLHGRVNFRESYREHLVAFSCESKSWLVGSLRSLLRTMELRDLS